MAQQTLALRQNAKAALKARVCGHVGSGGSLRTLEAAGVVSQPTVKDWRRKDPVFEACYQRARARAKARKLGPILRATLGGEVGLNATALTSLFRDWFGLSRSEAITLHVLYRAKGLFRPAGEIANEAGATEATLLRAHIPRLRQAMDSEAIDTSNGCYALTESGMEECQAVILATGEEFARMGEELRRVG